MEINHFRSREWHHNGKRGKFIDMRANRKCTLTSQLDIEIDRESAHQICRDVGNGTHKCNVYYHGVVRDEDVPNFYEIAEDQLVRVVSNCKDELYGNYYYFNCFVFRAIGENNLKNVEWYILSSTLL